MLFFYFHNEYILQELGLGQRCSAQGHTLVSDGKEIASAHVKKSLRQNLVTDCVMIGL